MLYCETLRLVQETVIKYSFTACIRNECGVKLHWLCAWLMCCRMQNQFGLQVDLKQFEGMNVSQARKDKPQEEDAMDLKNRRGPKAQKEKTLKEVNCLPDIPQAVAVHIAFLLFFVVHSLKKVLQCRYPLSSSVCYVMLPHNLVVCIVCLHQSYLLTHLFGSCPWKQTAVHLFSSVSTAYNL